MQKVRFLELRRRLRNGTVHGWALVHLDLRPGDAETIMKRVVLLRKSFYGLQDARHDTETSWDLLDFTTDAVIKAQKQFKRDRHFRRPNHEEFVAVLEEIVQDLTLIKQRLDEGI
jgi:hypothetical protein